MPFEANTPTPDVGHPEIIMVDSRVMPCDGGEGPLGHPRVWLNIEDEQIFCPYCSRIFRLQPGAGDDYGH
jgi:uncharacterized Zn-finger protein